MSDSESGAGGDSSVISGSGGDAATPEGSGGAGLGGVNASSGGANSGGTSPSGGSSSGGSGSGGSGPAIDPGCNAAVNSAEPCLTNAAGTPGQVVIVSMAPLLPAACTHLLQFEGGLSLPAGFSLLTEVSNSATICGRQETSGPGMLDLWYAPNHFTGTDPVNCPDPLLVSDAVFDIPLLIDGAVAPGDYTLQLTRWNVFAGDGTPAPPATCESYSGVMSDPIEITVRVVAP